MTIKGTLNSYYSQLKGFKTNRKIVVIESDDWGAVRIPSKEALNFLLDAGVNLGRNVYNKIDTLESKNDLYALYEVLDNVLFRKYRPKITFNFILANPDFDKIRRGKFANYYFESFLESYEKRDGNLKIKALLDDGIDSGFIMPQFHGREHVHALRWLHELKVGNTDFLKAFEAGCFCVDKDLDFNLLGAFEFKNENEKTFIFESIIQGLKMFENIFSFKSVSAVAPRHIWNQDIESVLASCEVLSIQSSLNQLQPSLKGYRSIYHFTGEKNRFNQIYLVRNAYFEPAYTAQINWIEKVLDKARVAFFLKTPLIISMHRINFVGGLEESNRTLNLAKLKQLLSKLIEIYPDIEFLTSDELVKVISDRYVRN